jgi:hypothetical protein
LADFNFAEPFAVKPTPQAFDFASPFEVKRQAAEAKSFNFDEPFQTKAASESKGFFGDFGESIKSPWKLWTEESIPALITKGVQRIAEDPAKAKKELSELKVPESGAIVQGSTKLLKDLAEFAVERPGALTAELVNSLVADPYLIFLPKVMAARLAKTGASLGAKAGAAAAEYGPKIGYGVGTLAGGAISGAAPEAARQFSTGEYDPTAVANAANVGAAMGAVSELGLAGVRKLRGKPPAAPGVTQETPYDSAAAARAQLNLFERTPGAAQAPTAEAPPAGTARYYARGGKSTTRATLTKDPNLVKAPEAARFIDLTPAEEAALKPTSKAGVRYTTDAELIRSIQPGREITNTLSPGMIQGAFGEGLEPWRTAIRRGAKAGALGAAVGAAISLGLNKDSPDHHLAYGLGFGVAMAIPRLLRRSLGGDIAPLLNSMHGAQNEMAFNVKRWADASRQLVPDSVRREAITAAVENPALMQGLSADEQLVAKSIKKFNESIGATAKREGILDNTIENYIAHLVEHDNGWRPRPDEFRKYKTFADLEKAIENTGMRVKTKDAVEITNLYANSMFQTLTQQRAGQAIQDFKLPNGGSVVKKNPGPDYRMVDYGPLRGNAVHADMLPAYENAFIRTPALMRDVTTPIAIALKRMSVFGSMFHAMSLKQGFMGTMGIKKGLFNSKKFVEDARKTFVGDDPNAQELLRQGLILSREYDIDPSKMNSALQRGASWVDSKVPGVGVRSKVDSLAHFSEALDQFTFSWLQNGYKMAASLHLMEQAMNPTKRGFLAKRMFGDQVLTREQAAKAAASFANDNFGSLDWFRMASETQSAFMKNLAYKLTSSPGRALMQIVMFAPDWTFATFRAAYKSMPGATDTPGLAAMHRLYTIKSAMIYMTVANAVNYMFTGHSIFENKNIMRADLGNGREMQLSKHFVEPYEWALHTMQTGLNKLGGMIKIPAGWALNKEYLSATGAPDIIRPSMSSWEGVLARAMYLLQVAQPISAQQSGGLLTGASSWFGFPVYGKELAEKQKLAIERAQDRAASREKRAEQAGTPWRVQLFENLFGR